MKSSKPGKKYEEAKSVFKLVLANRHYKQFGWELVSQRYEDDHIRNDNSTFTSIARGGGPVNPGAAWEFVRVGDRLNKYEIRLCCADEEDDEQHGWKLCAEI